MGLERALQHIEEARQLSRELGGTDTDVKAYFFSLPPYELQKIFTLYGQKYGADKRQYAEETYPRWRSGQRQMSGLVASRLFNLLPPQMSLADKYRLTEKLWEHVGPSSKKTLRVGLQASLDEVLQVVRDHIEQVVINYKIPEGLEKRFEWLAAGDVHVKQQLLNHLRQREKSLVIEGARVQVPVMLEHLRGDAGRYTHRLAQILKVGKHELELLIDKAASGVALVETSSMAKAATSRSHPLPWILIIAVVGLVLLALTGHR